MQCRRPKAPEKNARWPRRIPGLHSDVNKLSGINWAASTAIRIPGMPAKLDDMRNEFSAGRDLQGHAPDAAGDSTTS
jgi:hypothetical protein